MGVVPRRRFLGWTGAAVVGAVSLPVAVSACAGEPPAARVSRRPQGPVVALPPVRAAGALSLEQAMAGRHSVRAFRADPVSSQEVAQLLWAAQGITHEGSRRTAPSAGALYALELYAAGPAGTLRYIPDGHRAEQASTRAQRAALASAGGRPQSLVEAAILFVVTVTPSRLAAKYGDRAGRYADLEAGHATQNLLLQAVSLGLGAVPVGSFDDDAVASVLNLPDDEFARYLVAVGRPS